MKTKLHYVLTTAMLLFAFSALSQTNFFSKVNDSKSLQKRTKGKVDGKGVYYQFDYEALSETLSSVSKQSRSSKSATLILSFPSKNGVLERFEVSESSVLHPDLQAKYPEIKSFVAKSLDNPSVHMRFSLSPYNGLSAMVLGREKTLVYQPVKDRPDEILVTSKSNVTENVFLECASLNADLGKTLKSVDIKDADDGKHRKYRVAISVTGEYAQANGGTLASVNGAINATLTNINAVFEKDFNVSLELISTNDAVIYLNASTDPYTTLSNYNQQLATTLDNVVLEANYDIGHLFGGINDANGNGTGDAGCLGCVCNNGGSYAGKTHKGAGFSTSATPHGVNFDINYVAHEMGHQFGATHTWSHDGNEGFNSQMEPGSGSTILGYAGITGSYNLQLNSDPYFHAISIEQVTTFVKSTTCATVTDTGNTTPIVDAGDDLILPIGTAFKLEGTSTDSDGDVITYSWEQFDENDASTIYPNPDDSNSNSVLFRSFLPTENNIRYFPNLSDLRFGLNSMQWEKVPNVGRTADFRLTVRDNKLGGGSNNHDDVHVTFDSSYGPFEVTSQNKEGISWVSGTTETITWRVNSTNNLSGASHVDILLSTDGGMNYSEVLASNVPNDGSYTLVVPETPAPYCRIMVVPTDNYFFSINTYDFSINYTVDTTCNQYTSSSNLGLVITDNGKAFTQSHTINVGASATITDINIGVNISHDYIGDLEFAVVSPQGTEVKLKYHEDCSDEVNILGLYDDDAETYNCSDSASGLAYQPLNELLSQFDGENIAGDWTIRLGDFDAGDQGTLNSWFIEICDTTETSLDNPDNPNKDENLVVFPNPSEGDFILKMYNPSNNDIHISILDLNNRLIYEDTKVGLTNLEETLSLRQAQSGMYILYVTNGVKTFTKKIIIR
ncbi:zinc-dependent metalloprotease family protein [Tamlana sp. 2_MG-2023]|uniref:zinc-dependent metalloprotease n=1 Tax=unclassified Tamlana TaxID=2614803 RepID=UPI0026E2ADCD|nr:MULTISPECIES: zinc-dependent metalloprotease family protein [unclassified Tamlana]MDO6759966.1 zinc-dependent metalloprotease family protein [Tamlana sp. 2_MG-2023]MDO6791864.1 zinc-dependent metalloprotease family protein [Tamlana sp. 1_MG-2023]